ncbi:hypothetical protein Hanom_Chr10g00878101 [Helianthus anomalus]
MKEDSDDASGEKPTYKHVIVASSIGLVLAATMHFGLKRRKRYQIIPRIGASDTGQPLKIETFPHYVGMIHQMRRFVMFNFST